MVGALVEFEELIFEVRIFGDHLTEVHTGFVQINEPLSDTIVGAPRFFLREIKIDCAHPSFQHRSKDAQVPAAMAQVFHVAAQNNPFTESQANREMSKVFIVYEAGS
jgi:hypothetical protein